MMPPHKPRMSPPTRMRRIALLRLALFYRYALGALVRGDSLGEKGTR